MQLGVFGWYQVNKGYISQVLCENRNMPEMHCDGKCVLAQKLKQAEKSAASDQQAPPEIEVSISAFIIHKLPKVSQQSLAVQKLEWKSESNHYHRFSDSGLFRPPRMS